MGFFDGGGKSLSFGEVGSQQAAACFKIWRGGVITDIGEARQGTDFKTKKPLTWDNGDPMMQLPITLDTARGKCPERAETAEDDLVRTLFITKGKSMFAAARAALRKANVNDFEVGGSLYVCWTSGEGRTGDARQYEMYYEAPVGNSGGFMGEPQTPAYDPATGQPLNAAASNVNATVQASMPPQTPPPGPQGGDFQPGAAPAGPPAGQPGTPPPPVWNAQTQQPEPAAPPAAPPPPPQPVWNGSAWVIPEQAAPPAAQPAAPAANGWSPGPQSGPPTGGPQGAAQPAGNPFARR